MGQRARRQLAEKQFGTGARHLSLSGLPSGGGGQPATAQLSHAATKRPGAAGATVRGNTVAAAEESLHPSWAAKRQQRVPLIVPPEGKKVVFGDDGAPARVMPAAAASREPPGKQADRRGGKQGAMSWAGVLPTEGNTRVAHGNGKRCSVADSTARKSAQPPANGNSRERVLKGGVRFWSKGASVPDASAEPRKATGSATGLHPSWAAKKLLRQQMERLPAPQGAKVVFQDSD